MNRRLECLYQLLPVDGHGIIDVGTDHAQIPIQLAENGYKGNLFASDIAEGPLRTAHMAARSHQVEERIHFLNCDGLELCPPDAVDTILIAGMGGDTICGILDRAEWVFDGDYLLVLQPMTHAEVLRYWLVHNGYRIDLEAVIADSGQVYQIFTARLGKSSTYTDTEYLTGLRETARAGDPPFLLQKREKKRLEKIRDGLQKAGKGNSAEALFYKKILLDMEEAKNADH